MDEKMIEAVARAIARVRHGDDGYREEDDGVQYWELCITEAKAAIEAMEPFIEERITAAYVDGQSPGEWTW
jgi:hypothetical protein